MNIHVRPNDKGITLTSLNLIPCWFNN